MPELPEVETIRRQLEPRLVGRRVIDAWAFDSPKFTPAATARGAAFQSLDRRGKYLLAGLDDGRILAIHLGMTGSLRLDPSANVTHVRARWALDDDRVLVFDDVRRFGRIAIVTPDDMSPMPTLANIGPEPFDPRLGADVFHRGLNAGRRHLKTKVLDQRVVAGVGNIYSDEAFFAAGVNPADRRIGVARAARLLEALRGVLAEGLEHGGTTLRDYVDADGGRGTHQLALRCYGRAGQPCHGCGSALRRAIIDGRSTTWCPACQPRRR